MLRVQSHRKSILLQGHAQKLHLPQLPGRYTLRLEGLRTALPTTDPAVDPNRYFSSKAQRYCTGSCLKTLRAEEEGVLSSSSRAGRVPASPHPRRLPPPASMLGYNPTFKPPTSAQQPGRSPSPPRKYVEPLSPARPHPIEPVFNYPALNNHINFSVRAEQLPAATPRTRNKSVSYESEEQTYNATPRTRHRSSTIEQLAEAALATSPRYHAHSSGGPNSHSCAPPVHSEPPHKRSRSELLPSPLIAQYASRPATSYENSAWHNLPMQHAQHAQHGEPVYDRRVEEAALLLNFRTGGWTTPKVPPPTCPGPLIAPNAPRPHANSFPQDAHQPRPVELAASAALLPPFKPQDSFHPRPTLPSPQQTTVDSHSSANDESDKLEDTIANSLGTAEHALQFDVEMQDAPRQIQTQTPPNEDISRAQSTDLAPSETSDTAATKAKRGGQKGKARATGGRKSIAEKAASRRVAARKKTPDASKARSNASVLPVHDFVDVHELNRNRRKSVSDLAVTERDAATTHRAQSVPRDTPMIVRSVSPVKVPTRRKAKDNVEITCAGCATAREAKHLNGELDEWISCNGCKKWFHVDCAGFKKAIEVRDVDKYFCTTCEPTHGKTTYVRKSTRAHASVDYAELQRGVLKTSEEDNEHHYIQPIKDGTFQFDPESFPRMRPELVTRDIFERSGTFTEPICIPAAWNPRPWLQDHASAETQEGEGDGTTANGGMKSWSAMQPDEYEYDAVPDDGQDRLGMVMPEELTVRQVCNLVGPDTPLDVIDVKTQNSGSKWTLARWADYYEEAGDDKPIRNVISLEVSQTKLGRLLRRPKIVRDIDLQDDVWPRKEIDLGKWPKVQYYCLMSVADSYTDFHIDFGGSSVYYHILKGKKTFFFIPPKAKHLKAYEEWNDSPQQNYTFLPNITKECYRVNLSEGDTMLIPSGWIHAVWTPETSLVIGGNFLTRMSFQNQFKVVDIEKANETPMKFRYPYFQKIMWYTAIKYLKEDPLPDAVSQLLHDGKRFERQQPVWADFDGDLAANDPRPGAKNTRYYGQAELDGLPDLVTFIFHTVMLVMGRVEGISADRIKRVNASIPKGHGEPLEVAKTFALWVAWKRNEDPPAWAHPDAVLPNSKEGLPKKLSARALKDLERKEAIAAWRLAPDRQSARVKSNATATASGSAHSHGPTAIVSTSTPDRENTHHQNLSSHHQTPSQIQTNQTYAHQTMPTQASPVATPMNLMVGGLPHLSSPKTSVLGPKRVACDACRKRRIRCKHKDMVLQTSPNGSSMHYMSPDAQYNGHEMHDDIVVKLATDGGHGLAPSGVQSQPLPGTNAYVNAHIPMAVNGVAIFDPSKRGRTKACYECRKSKVQSCLHLVQSFY